MSNKYYMCKEEEDKVDHILLHCSKAIILWQLIQALCGIKWVKHSLVRKALLSWHGSFIGKKEEKKLGESLLCTYYGPYGRGETREPLKILKNKQSNNHLSIIIWNGQGYIQEIALHLYWTLLIGRALCSGWELFFVFLMISCGLLAPLYTLCILQCTLLLGIVSI